MAQRGVSSFISVKPPTTPALKGPEAIKAVAGIGNAATSRINSDKEVPFNKHGHGDTPFTVSANKPDTLQHSIESNRHLKAYIKDTYKSMAKGIGVWPLLLRLHWRGV
jgi:hypothetical protein